MNKYNNMCPVCGYNQFTKTLKDHDICPSCLFTFFVNDMDWTPEELREDWIADGARWAWGSQDIPKPQNWSAIEQLKNIPYHVTDEEKRLIAPDEPSRSRVFSISGFMRMQRAMTDYELLTRQYLVPS